MAGTRSDLTPAVNTAMQAREGTGFCHCVEMTFGQAIRARPSAPTLPDTEVSWTGRGDLTKLQVYTSVDEGLTWQRVARSGDPIPKLAFDDTGTAYSAARAATTNRSVVARLIFENGASAVVDSFTLRATYEDGSVIERVETGSALATGRLIGCAYDPGVGGLLGIPETTVRLHGDRGGLANANETPHDAEGNRTGLHLSHGVDATPLFSPFPVEQQVDGDTRKADAAMTIEGWFYAEKTSGVLCGWLARAADLQPGPHGTVGNHGALATFGLMLELVATSDAGARVRLRCTELGVFPDHVFSIVSGDDAVQLERWHHVAFSYDGFWSTAYLDGVVFSRAALKASFNGIRRRKGVFEPFGIVVPTTGSFVMGRHPVDSQNVPSTETSFQGRLSEWRFYAKAITGGAVIRRRFRRLEPAEVAQMVAEDGLVAYYPMHLGVGTACLDYTGNDNHLAWTQQQVGTTRLPPQIGWLPSPSAWRGFPTGTREVLPGIIEARDRSPGRQTPALSLDHDGEVLRATDAPFDVTFDGKTFIGVGSLGAVDTVQEAGDLVPTSATFTLTGVEQSKISLALTTRYLDRPVRLYQVTWDEDGAQLDPFLVFEGRLDEMNVALGAFGSVSVSAESHLRNWRRPKNRRWNHQAQQTLWPDDGFFQFLAEMVDRQVWWPVRVQDTQASGGG